MTVSYVGAGAITTANPNDPITPPLPSGLQAGDLILCFHMHRSNAVTNTVSAGWSTHDYNNDYNIEQILYYRVATGTDSAPTITPDGQAPSVGYHAACCVAFRGIDQVTPFGDDGAKFFYYGTNANIGPIQPLTASGDSGVLLVVGCRAENVTPGGTAAVLSGDGLTWNEAFDGGWAGPDYPFEPFVLDYAIWTGGAPTVTEKTFTVSGGVASYSVGRMYQLRGAAETGTLISVVGSGTPAVGDHDDVLVPQLPQNTQTNNFLFCIAYRQQAGALTLSDQNPTSGRIYYNQDSLSRSTTYSTTYVTKVSLQFTPTSGDKYLLLWNSLVDDPVWASEIINTRLRHQTASADISVHSFTADGTTPRYSGGIAIYDAADSSLHTFFIDYASQSGSQIGIAEASLCAIKLGASDVFIESLAQTDNSTTTTYTAKATLSWTPATAGDYLIIASARISCTGGVNPKVRVNNGTTQYNQQDPSDYPADGLWKPYVAIIRGVNLSGAQSWALEFSRASASGTVSISHARVVALRLSDFAASYWAEDRNADTSTSATWADTGATVTATPNAYSHIVISAGIVGSTGNEGNTYVGNRISAGGSPIGSAFQYENPWDTTFFNWFSFRVRTESAVSTTWKTQFNRQSGSGAASTDENVIAVLQLAGAGGGGGSGGWTQHSSTNTTQNGVPFLLQTWYRFADGTQTAPYISVTGGSTSPQTVTGAIIAAYSNVNALQPFASDASDSFNASAANVGPVAVPTSLPTAGAVVAIGIRSSAWTSAATLDGDGLTWSEIVDNVTNTVGSSSFSLAIDFARWEAAPTLSSKTFVITGGSSAPGMGKMFALNAASESGVATNTLISSFDLVTSTTSSLSSSFDLSVISSDVWAGPVSTGNNSSNLTPTLPTGLLNGDLLMAFGFIRNDGTFSVSDNTWTEHSIVDTFINSEYFYLRTWYCIYNGTQTAPTLTISGGSTSPQTVTLSFVIAARGVNSAVPFGSDGTDSFNTSATNVGPIAVPSSLPTSGIALIFGERHGTVWNSVATLTGDGKEWVEVFDNYTHSVSSVPISTVLNYTKWSGSAPTLTAKTFVPTGGSAGAGFGKTFVLNMAFAATVTVSSSFDLSVLASNSVIAAMDLYVPPLSSSIGADLDLVVIPGNTSVTTLAFLDLIVIEPPVGPSLVTTPVQDLSLPATEYAWLVLLTIDHADMSFPIRVTSDSVPTTSSSYTYSPFPFEVVLPDDVEGRAPQASLRIDNTTQEIIAVLRGLVTPPRLTIQIVRSITPDIIEYQWVGLRWSTTTYDKGSVTGTLTVRDLSKEEFPYVTMDSRFIGLWP